MSKGKKASPVTASQELIEYPTEKVAAPVVSEQSAMIQMIERVAMNPGVDVDKLERLLDMQEKVMNKQNEAAFNQAMNSAQQEMGPISADAHNPQTRSNYATYGKLDKKLRPIYTRNGFAISYDTADSPLNDKESPVVRVLAYVSHRDGHTRTYHVDLDASGKGAKGGDVMTKTHAAGSAMAYGMRYLLKLIFNVAIGEEDDDGNAANQEPIYVSEDQLKQLRDKIKEVGAVEDAFCKVCKVESLDKILASKFDGAMKRLDMKAKA